MRDIWCSRIEPTLWEDRAMDEEDTGKRRTDGRRSVSVQDQCGLQMRGFRRHDARTGADTSSHVPRFACVSPFSD